MSIDLHTLSGAYAVNALSAEEAESFTRHLEQCAACRDEVRELRAAAATMGASEAVPPPSTLKARVLAAADQQPQLPPRVTPIEQARSRRWTTRLVGAAAAVILVVAAGIGIRMQTTEDRPPVAASPVAQVFDAPDAHTATVPTANGGKVKVATSAEAGRMAVETSGLPELERRSYQMWAIHNGKPTSVGVIEDLDAGKVMPMPASGTTVAITVEPEGGSKQPTRQPILEVDPEAV